MVRFCERTDSFKFTWDQVAQAFWHRYPNPYSSHVQTVDILARKVEDGKLYSKRLLTKTVRVPYFGKKLTISNEPIIEESLIDLENRIITTYTWNIGGKGAVVEEKCLYKPVEEKHFEVERQAWISSTRFYFSRAIESFLVRKFRKTINRTCMGLQHVLESRFSHVAHERNALNLMENKEKLCEKAKKATELAKSKAVPLLAACGGNKQ